MSTPSPKGGPPPLPKYPPRLSAKRNLIPYDTWIKRTAVLGRFRSTELKALDQALKAYEDAPSEQALKLLIDRLDAWKATQGQGDAWKKSSRNRDGQQVEKLTSMIWGGDSDRFNVPYFMIPEVVHSRLGVIYLLSRLGVETDYFGVILEGGLGVVNGALGYAGASVSQGGLGMDSATIASAGLTTAMIPGSVLLNGTVAAAGQATIPTTPAMQHLGSRVKAWLADFAQKVLTTLKEKFGEIDFTLAALKNLLNVCMQVFLANAAPFVSAGMDIAKGLVNSLDAAAVRLRSWYLGRNVTLTAGHPNTVVDSIHRAMTLSLFEGLYQQLKGAASAALTATAAWATLLMNLLVAIGETIIKVVWRKVETTKMRTCFEEAKGFWDKRDSADALQKHPFAFGEWYRKHALCLPALAILTLNSGICGDKMTYLSLFDSDQLQAEIDIAKIQPRFDQGVRYLDDLKPWGAEYLSKCAYEFSSSDELVGKLITFSQSHAGQRDQVWAKIRKVVNA
jgi:hypothetical protein